MEIQEKHLYIVFRTHLCRIRVDDLSQKSSTEKMIKGFDYWKDGIPVGMGSFIFDSKFYLVGGEDFPIRLPPPAFRPDYSPSASDTDNNDTHLRSKGNYDNDGLNLNQFLFMLDPSNPLRPSLIQSKRCAIKAGKPHPSVFNIDDKIYLLGGDPYRYMYKQALPSPQFECYHPHTDTWEALEDPPYFAQTRDSPLPFNCLAFYNVYALGRRIYLRSIASRNYFYFYDVDDRKWHQDPQIIERYQLAGVPFPFVLARGCFLERNWKQGGEVLVIAFTRREGLVAYLYDPSSTNGWDLPKQHQIFDSVKLGLHLVTPIEDSSTHSPCLCCYCYCSPPTDLDLVAFSPTAFIRELGEDDKVILFSTDYKTVQFAILRVTRLQTNGEGFLDVKLLHHHLFEYHPCFYDLVRTDFSVVENVLVYEHPKKPIYLMT